MEESWKRNLDTHRNLVHRKQWHFRSVKWWTVLKLCIWTTQLFIQTLQHNGLSCVRSLNIWQLVRYANSQDPPQAYWIRRLYKFRNHYFIHMLSSGTTILYICWVPNPICLNCCGIRTKIMQSWDFMRSIFHPNKILWELRTSRILKYTVWSEVWPPDSQCLSYNLFLTDFY